MLALVLGVWVLFKYIPVRPLPLLWYCTAGLTWEQIEGWVESNIGEYLQSKSKLVRQRFVRHPSDEETASFFTTGASRG